MIKQLKDYAPAITGILLIAAGLWLPLGTHPGSPRLIDLFSHWVSHLWHTI